MDIVTISHPSGQLKCDIQLPSSKSESNRILMIKAISGLPIEINNLSPAKDTQILNEIIQRALTEEGTFDVGHAGTTMRFLTAWFATLPGERIITGSERMLQRPIGVLVDALRALGADIEYLGQKGYPPLKIIGDTLHGGEVSIDGNVSSQFISALLMISPLMQRGLVLHLKSGVVSEPYIQMTLNLMARYGVIGLMTSDHIHVAPQHYFFEDEEDRNFDVEGDWSSASYWFSMVSLSKHAEIRIKNLREESIQGDAVGKNIYHFFNVQADWENGDLVLRNIPKLTQQFQYNFEDCPDIAQSVAVVAAAHQVPSIFTGLQTLRIKETDRIAALQQELKKCDVVVETFGNESIEIKPENLNLEKPLLINTYQDHRMAMAFAPLALKRNNLQIENPIVVEKSYPGFWADLQKAGFKVSFEPTS